MLVEEFRKYVADVSHALDMALSNKVDFEKDTKGNLLDYRGVQQEHYRRAFYQAIEALERASKSLHELVAVSEHNERVYAQVQELITSLNKLKTGTGLREAINKIDYYSAQFEVPKTGKVVLRTNTLPQEIQSELVADVEELNKCFNSGCYRSAVILCGRILETALHRKYYDVTGNDLLETSPGLGLGNLIAKMAEKGIKMDPGLTNQIHLINQIRIHSVHKKQDSFQPSKIQSNAIMLYTLDVVEKLFR